MKKPLFRMLAISHYCIGAVLFFTGIAKLHLRIHELAMRELQRSADLGWGKAQVLFGQLLKYRGATAYNKIASIGYLRASASEGNREAQFMLAEALTDKSLMDVMPVEAESKTENSDNQLKDPVALYLSAAKAGHVMSALRLNKIYEQGLFGIKPDNGKAEYWFSEFIKHGKQI